MSFWAPQEDEEHLDDPGARRLPVLGRRTMSTDNQRKSKSVCVCGVHARADQLTRTETHPFFLLFSRLIFLH